MFDHVQIPVGDLETSREFYRRALEPLGLELTHDGPDACELGALALVPGGPLRDPVHIAFVAETREAVDEFHRVGLEAGGRDNGRPGLRDYAPDYYAAYLYDPDGHNIEAVHRSPETRAQAKRQRTGHEA